MATIPYYIDGEDADAGLWDFCWLGDIFLPGVVSIDVKDEFSFDTGKAQGNDGAPVTYKGRNPRTLDLTLKITNRDQFVEWLEVRKQLNAFASGKAVQPYQVTHPQAQSAGITSAYLKSISQPQPTSNQPWLISMSLIENNPAKPSKQNTAPAPKAQTQNTPFTLSPVPGDNLA